MSIDEQFCPEIPSGIGEQSELIATFYGTRDSLQLLIESLCYALKLNVSGTSGHKWGNTADSDREILLDCLQPIAPYGHDTTVVQLVLNEPGDAHDAWTEMYKRLMSVRCPKGIELKGIWGSLYRLFMRIFAPNGIEIKEILNKLAAKEVFWGYTLVYGAVLKVPLSIVTDFPLKKPLAKTDIGSGRLWLHEIPLKGFVSIYTALTTTQEHSKMLDILYGEESALFATDLIAHKGYLRIRSYYSGLKDHYEKLTGRLIQTIPSFVRNKVPGKKNVEETCRQISLIIPILDSIHIGLEKQKYNYDIEKDCLLEEEGFYSDFAKSNILDYHRKHIESVSLEVKLLMEIGDSITNVVESALERMHEQRQQRNDFFLAMIGIGLAVAQVVNSEIAGKILAIPFVNCNHPFTILICSYIDKDWRTFAVQVFSMVVPLLLLFISWCFVRVVQAIKSFLRRLSPK